jgi:hypothetical protein
VTEGQSIPGQPAHVAEARSTPERLFKYMPSEYVEDFVRHGRILLRNLTYFRQLEGDRVRGDLYEGSHIDRPGGGVTITNVRTGYAVTGDFAYVNSVRREHIFVFCLSTMHAAELYESFGADACVEIESPTQWLQACQRAATAISWPGPHKFLHGPVEYYEQGAAVTRSIKDPAHLPFFKPAPYRQQAEYRLVAAPPRGLTLKERIVVGHALAENEAPRRTEEASIRWLRLGGRRPYMKVHRR